LYFRGKWRLPVSLKCVGRNSPGVPKTDRTEKGKRAKKKSKRGRRAGAKGEGKSETPASAKESRESVLNFLRSAALEVAKGVVDAAKKGQLAHAKLLFEMTGIHPASEEAMANAPQEVFIQTLLREAKPPAESGT
jgi:hypothetical protein